MSGLLSRLASVPRPTSTAQVRYTDPASGGAQSLTVRVPPRWQVTAYDKGTERLQAVHKAHPADRPRLSAEADVARVSCEWRSVSAVRCSGSAWASCT